MSKKVFNPSERANFCINMHKHKRAIIVHGWSGSSQKDWMPWAKEELEKLGYKVIVPDLPDTDNPKIETWVQSLAQVAGELRRSDILIGHSMGCQTILRFLATLPEGQKVGRVILVAGFGPYLKGLTEEESLIAKPWMETPIDFDLVKTRAGKFIAFFSDNDPFVPLEENKKLFEEKLAAEIIVEPDKGHFNDMSRECPDLLQIFDR